MTRRDRGGVYTEGKADIEKIYLRPDRPRVMVTGKRGGTALGEDMRGRAPKNSAARNPAKKS